MTLNEIMQIAIDQYPDGCVGGYWDPKTESVLRDADSGDTLALFVAIEIKDTYDATATEREQLEQAERCCETAADEMSSLAHHFRMIKEARWPETQTA
jgi:hypothetical protein